MIPSIGLDVLVRLADKLSAPLKDVENTVAKSAQRMEKRLALSVKLGAGGAAASAVALGAERMVSGFTNSIRDVERAKGELATLGVRDLDAVVSRGRELQAQLAGVTAGAFVRASYDIKSGISSLTDQGVADMTASAMVTAKATKGQAEQMTSLFATSYGIFKKQMADLTDAEFGNRFGAALSASVQQFKTDGGAMQQAIESTGAGAVNLGMRMTEQLTLLGMMQQQMQAGEAGTALRAFASNAARAHENFAKMKVTADRPVRVRVLDENGQLRAMPDILSDLKDRYGDTLDAFEAAEIGKAFGTEEAMKMINALYGQEAAVRANADALGDAADRGAAFTKEMAKAADSNWDATMVLLGQKMDVLRQKIGSRLLPVVQKFTPVIDRVIDRAFAWIDANPKLVTGIGAAVAGIGALAAVVGPVLLGTSALVAGFEVTAHGATRLYLAAGRVGKGIAVAGKGVLWLGRTVLPVVGKALLVVGRTLLANPLALAIAAVAGGAYLIYRNWEPIVDWFSDLWARVTSTTGAAWDWIKNLLARHTPQGLFRAWTGLTSWFSRLWTRVAGGISTGWDAIRSTLSGYTAAGLVHAGWTGLTAWFSRLWTRVAGGISTGWDAIRSTLSGYTAAGLVYAGWTGLTAWFSRLWTRVAGGISTGWDAIRSTLSGYTAAGLVHAGWTGLAEWFTTIWGGIADGVPEGWTKIAAEVSKWPGKMKAYGAELIQKLIDGIKTKFAALKNAVSDALALLNPFSNIKVNLRTTSVMDNPAVASAAQKNADTAEPSGLDRLKSKIPPDIRGGSIADQFKAPPIQERARGGAFSPGWLLTGEEGPELRYATEAGYIAHNRALRSMVAMASRVRQLVGVAAGVTQVVPGPAAGMPEIASSGRALRQQIDLGGMVRGLAASSPATGMTTFVERGRDMINAVPGVAGNLVLPGVNTRAAPGPAAGMPEIASSGRALRQQIDLGGMVRGLAASSPATAMTTFVERGRDMINAIAAPDQSPVPFGASPSVASVAAAGPAPRQDTTFAPNITMPMTFGEGVDADQVRRVVHDEMRAATDRMAAELRGVLYDD